jgi:DNA-binding transcriptional regulator YiaG
LIKLTELAYNISMKKWTAKNIKSLRKQLKVSQTSFGELLGVTRNYIYYLERGEKEPSKTLCLLFNCVEKEYKKKGE